MACTTKHDNSYCSIDPYVPRLRVDVAYERYRIQESERWLASPHNQDNGTDKRRNQRAAHRQRIEDSEARLDAVRQGCAAAVSRAACPVADFVDGVCENCGVRFGSDVAHGSQL